MKTPLLPLRAAVVCEPGCFGAAWALGALKDAQAPVSGWCCTQSQGPEPARSAASPAWLAAGGEGCGESPAEGPELSAGSSGRQTSTGSGAKAFKPSGEGSAGVT